MQKRRRRRRRRQIRGRLGSEAGYSQAAPVAIWRYELQAVIVTKKKKKKPKETNKHTAQQPCFLLGVAQPLQLGKKTKNRSFNTSSIHAYIVHSLKSLICQQHINNIEPISIFISMFSEEHASQLDTVNCCHWKCHKL